MTTAIERGLLERSRGEIRPTPLGLRFLNDLLGLFLGDAGAVAAQPRPVRAHPR